MGTTINNSYQSDRIILKYPFPLRGYDVIIICRFVVILFEDDIKHGVYKTGKQMSVLDYLKRVNFCMASCNSASFPSMCLYNSIDFSKLFI